MQLDILLYSSLTHATVVEGVFSVGENPKVEKILKDNDIDHYQELIVRRELLFQCAELR